jgi:hypothetical protein
MIKFLRKCIRKRDLPHYFDEDVNLINLDNKAKKLSLEAEKKKIHEFIGNPKKYMGKGINDKHYANDSNLVV